MTKINFFVYFLLSFFLASFTAFAGIESRTLISCSVKNNMGMKIRLTKSMYDKSNSIERSFNSEAWENIITTSDSYFFLSPDGLKIVSYYDSNSTDIVSFNLQGDCDSLEAICESTGTGKFISEGLGKSSTIMELVDCHGSLTIK